MTRTFTADFLRRGAADAWEVCTSPPTLRDGEVHVWKVALESAVENARRLGALLTAEERARATRFQFAKDRGRFVTGRGVVRLLTAAYLGRDAAGIELEAEDSGKPRLIRRDGEPPLEFNVSHSGKVVAIAFAMGRRVGIDVEEIRGDVDWHEIARRFFCAEEFDELRQLPEPEQRQGFFRCWTRKEAFGKAVGQGLGLPLSNFHGGTTTGSAPTLRDRQGREYTVIQFQPEIGYAGALAAEGAINGWRLLEWNPATLGL